MKIFIDFDDVLFDTKRFREDLQNLFFQHGISKEVFYENYYNPQEHKKVKTYDPWRHLDMIAEVEKIDKSEILEELNEFMIDTNPYLFNDSVDFLKAFDDEFICIISYGEPKFQKMKIGECRVGKYCEEIKITDELKSKAMEKELEKMADGEEVFFIEDRVEQIEDVKMKFPFVKTIFMRRPEGRYHDEPTRFCDFKAKNLEEAREIIKSAK